MKNAFLILLQFLIFSTAPAHALDAIKCSSEDFATLDLAHTTAKSHIEKAHQMLSSNDPLIVSGFKKYFNIDFNSPAHQKHIQNVKEMMGRIWSNVNRVKYRCGQFYKPYCQPGILALVPPLSRIQICPGYFDRTFEKQVGTLIHEWGHRWGSFRVGHFRLKYLFEKYCTETSGAKPEVLIHQPDSYMLFTYYLATNGKGIACFKLTEFLN